MCYAKYVSFIGFLMDSCMYDDILDTKLITDKSYYCNILNYQKYVGQIVCVDKTAFLRPGHI